MTVKEKLQEMLVKNGMFESQAKEVMVLAMPELSNLVDDYDITFDSSSDDYPAIIYKVLFLALKPIALKWIEENLPNAWYKPVFI